MIVQSFDVVSEYCFVCVCVCVCRWCPFHSYWSSWGFPPSHWTTLSLRNPNWKWRTSSSPSWVTAAFSLPPSVSLNPAPTQRCTVKTTMKLSLRRVLATKMAASSTLAHHLQLPPLLPLSTPFSTWVLSHHHHHPESYMYLPLTSLLLPQTKLNSLLPQLIHKSLGAHHLLLLSRVPLAQSLLMFYSCGRNLPQPPLDAQVRTSATCTLVWCIVCLHPTVVQKPAELLFNKFRILQFQLQWMAHVVLLQVLRHWHQFHSNWQKTGHLSTMPWCRTDYASCLFHTTTNLNFVAKYSFVTCP